MTAQTKHQVKVVKKNKDMNQLSATSNVILNIVFILAVIITVAPIWVIIMASFTSEKALQTYGYGFWPQEWSTYAYTFLFSKGSIIGTAYKNTIIATVVGTILCVISVGLYAYPISRKDFRWRNVFTFISFFTMLFNAGTVTSDSAVIALGRHVMWFTVPFYVTCRQILGIGNSVLALFLPMSFSAYWVIIMRTFYQSNVPDSIIESARIDGAGEWRTLIQIVLPLATPGLATVALFAAIGIWNNFFNCLLLVDEAKYYNLQFTIYQTLNSIRFLKEMASQVGSLAAQIADLPSETFRMAMAMVTMGPIILAYPFFQKYFVKGLTIGAVKG